MSLFESSILPIPIEVVTIPLFMADRKRVWLVALVATLGSVLGGILGYAIGYHLYEGLGRWLLEFYGYQNEFNSLQEKFREAGWYVVMVGGITPIPYKVVSIASGFARLAFPVFMAASLVSRSLRFLAFALLFYFFGPSVRYLLGKHGALLGWVVLSLLIAGFLVVFWL
ncbi:YqaA family protein [Dethiosulfatarculus sandiegensis]|uniref:YqaA family protein n=1 Tax=Dethiosulfatarculus sandiegensis TaxID=1429043 RepID=UPI0018D0AF64|nr:VTT domain-containing protein [Dethiosulfatarculus sandiegensis]